MHLPTLHATLLAQALADIPPTESAIVVAVDATQLPRTSRRFPGCSITRAVRGLRWPRGLTFAQRFVGISVFWVVHHSIFRSIRAYDRALLYLNFLFLMAVAFLEFPTSLVGHYSEEQVSVVI